MRRGLALTLVLALAAGAALAGPPERSPRPPARPVVQVLPPVEDMVASLGVRPTGPLLTVHSELAVVESLRPKLRPKGLEGRVVQASALVPVPAGKSRKGAVCGLPGVVGTTLSPIAGTVAGCGVDQPVRVTSVAGVALSSGAVMDCGTAKALDRWVRGGVLPAFAGRGGGVVRLQVAADYACRPRNNEKGEKISEHGKGRAIDISAFVLRSGAVVTVLKGWRDGSTGPILKALHRSACGPFGTVLGPGANGYHQDHLHLDTARYRAGSYCR